MNHRKPHREFWIEHIPEEDTVDSLAVWDFQPPKDIQQETEFTHVIEMSAVTELLDALDSVIGYIEMEKSDSKSPYANSRANVMRLVAIEECAQAAITKFREGKGK